MFKSAAMYNDKVSASRLYIQNGAAGISRSNGGDWPQGKLTSLRNRVEGEFRRSGYPETMLISEIVDSSLRKSLYDLVDVPGLRSFFDEISKDIAAGEPVSLFPDRIMRNSLPLVSLGEHGWHNDCKGEFKYDYCRRRLSRQYIFGKVQICLQENTEYGGGIDIMPLPEPLTSLRVESLVDNKVTYKRLRYAFKLLRIQSRLSKMGTEVSLGEHRISDAIASLAGAKTVNVPALTNIVFDHRVLHRGTPASPSVERKLIALQGKSATFLKPGTRLAKNKYVLYFHFGNQQGLDSFVYDRVRRDKWKKVLETYRNELDGDFFINSFCNSRKMLEEALLKASV